MNPPLGVILSACSDTASAPKVQDAPAPAATAADTVLVQVDEFIWQDMDRPAGAEPRAPQEVVEGAEAPRGQTELPKIVVLSDDESSEPEDGWRRQLISALQDVDREAGPLTPLPAVSPARTYIEDLQRPPPRSLSPARTTRMNAPAPIVRTPRRRIGPVLFGISAAAGLLTIAVPRTTTTPEMAALAATSEAIVTGSLAPTAGNDKLEPVFVNSPVLVREVTAPKPASAVRALPVIETVRTVPVPLRREAAVSEPAAPTMPPINPQAAPTPSAEPPTPAATSAPLDRDSLAALTAPPPAAPPQPQPKATDAPVAAAPHSPNQTEEAAPQEPAKTSPTATQPIPKRKPQISSSYERSAPKASRESRKRKARKSKTTSARAESKQWDTRRQGLRTSASTNEVKEVEPSTMVKLLKSLNPFASKEESQARPKKNIFE